MLERHRLLSTKVARKADLTTREAQQLSRLSRDIPDHLHLVQVSPANIHLLEQLVGQDSVHAFGAANMDDLVRLRVAEPGSNKLCLALVNTWTATARPQVLAAIYIYAHTGPIETPQDLPGNIAEILHTPCAPRTAHATAYTFYSISNIDLPDDETGKATPLFKGAGGVLIEKLFPFVERLGLTDRIFHTLSPLRTLAGAFPQVDLREADDRLLMEHAVKHLLSARNPVQRFHMGDKGATIGDIKLRPNTAGTPDELAMVNYLYPVDASERARNREMFRAGQLVPLFPEHLRPQAAVLAARQDAASSRMKIAP